MQLRRLDPLANAGPYQRLMRNPVKSFSLSEEQYERATKARPDLKVTDGEAAVVGYLLADELQVHYAFPDIEMFVDRFPVMLERVAGNTNKHEAPRGLSIAFRDRPNRMTADTVFWSVALEQGEQWVEMNLVAVPEQPEPGPSLDEEHEVVPVDDSNQDAAADIEAALTGRPRLSPAGVRSLREDAKFLGLVRKRGSEAVGLIALRTETGGWGVIDRVHLAQASEDLRMPLTQWAIAWLRGNGGRRVRRRTGVDATAELKALRELGFTPGEAGLYLARSVDKDEVKAKLSERKAHGTIIKFGDWR